MYLYGMSKDAAKFTIERFLGYPIEGSDYLDFPTDSVVAIVLDTETTGLDSGNDEIIEVAARQVEYDKTTGHICRIGEAFQALQEPSSPLSDEIKKITGLSDEDLAGQSIDWGMFDDFCSNAKLFVAHNAAFDRPFVDRHSKVSKASCWGCTLSQIPWLDWFPVAKQEVLALFHGFFYQGHRALIDVDSLVRLMQLRLPAESRDTYFSLLVSNARKSYYEISAIGAPFNKKDILKTNHYQWNARSKVWVKKVVSTQRDVEEKFLASQVYASGKFEGCSREIKPQDNFK